MTHDPILLDWIERAIHGDTEAFEEIYYTYKDDVYTACVRMLGNPAEAEDAAQDVFIRLLRVLPRYDHTRASFRTWLLTISTNYCYDQLRKRKAGEISMDDEENEPLAPSTTLGVRIVQPVWHEMDRQMMEHMKKITIADLCDHAEKQQIRKTSDEKMDFTI